ncbi:MAG: protein phosphatase 2C domain-containing protein [Myxococcota bacterium]
MKAASRSITGRRDNNEDASCARPDLGLYVVADGMGGHEGGEIASRVVVDTLVGFFERAGKAPAPELAAERMELAIRMARAEVRRLAVGALSDMGTTLVAMLQLAPDRALIAHLGDSRAYRMRGTTVDALTRDHSFVAELDAVGASRLVAQLPVAFTALVTRCISARMDAPPELQLVDIAPGDAFVLCSDGLSDVLDDADLAATLHSATDPRAAANRLVDAAFAAGSADNITALVLQA